MQKTKKNRRPIIVWKYVAVMKVVMVAVRHSPRLKMIDDRGDRISSNINEHEKIIGRGMLPVNGALLWRF